MRFNEATCNSMPPVFVGLQNNNQLQRSSSETIINDRTDSLIEDQDIQKFHIGQDTSTFSSLALNTKIQKHKISNNLDNAYQSSSTESLTDYEGFFDEDSQEQSGSDWSEYSEDANFLPGCRGIVNPNYPGFQHLGPSLLSDTDDTEEDQEFEEDFTEELSHQDEFNNNNNAKNSNNNHNNNNNNNSNSNTNSNSNKNNNNGVLDETVNRLDTELEDQKQFLYEKPKFNIQNVSSLIDCMNYVKSTNDLLTSNENSQKEVEIVPLTKTVNESLQFPKIEQISEPSKSSDPAEIEEEKLEGPIDLIREANALKQSTARSQTTNTLTNNSNININNKNNNNNNNGNKNINNININNNDNNMDTAMNLNQVSESSSIGQDLDPTTKLEEIDLLANINSGRETRCQDFQQKSSVPDVVAMELHKFQMKEQRGKVVNGEPEEVFHKDTKKNEKTMKNQASRRQQNNTVQRKKHESKCRPNPDSENGSFDVYNIETAMPHIDMDVIETHLKAAREEERRRRTDREEIRKRLAMGTDADDIRIERGRKPSLQSRLQSGMNLQICFMNDTSSDTESIASQDGNEAISSVEAPALVSNSCPTSLPPDSTVIPPSEKHLQNGTKTQVLSLPSLRPDPEDQFDEADFFARQARLQIEARVALTQAKEMAHMQMEIERQKLRQNPITEMVRESLHKVGVTLGEDRRRLSRALLTELNIAQLQVIANDLHARIATLNESLVEGLLRRDDLHMEQDSMLVDVEDLTRYLGAKQETQQINCCQPSGNVNVNGSWNRNQPDSRLHPQRKDQHQHQKQQQQQQQKQQQTTSRPRTLTLLSRVSSTRLAAGRQLVVNFVKK